MDEGDRTFLIKVGINGERERERERAPRERKRKNRPESAREKTVFIKDPPRKSDVA